MQRHPRHSRVHNPASTASGTLDHIEGLAMWSPRLYPQSVSIESSELWSI